jgi:hypothetical protein
MITMIIACENEYASILQIKYFVIQQLIEDYQRAISTVVLRMKRRERERRIGGYKQREQNCNKLPTGEEPIIYS